MVELLRTGVQGQPFFLPDPAYTGPVFAAEIADLIALQKDAERAAREEEILAEIDDIATPFLAELDDFGGPPGGVLRLINLMDMAGLTIGYHFKRIFGRPRPHIADPRIDPLIDVPTHSAYPSAHAVQTHLIAHALAEVYEDNALVADLFDVAARISINREWAGVHYASDTEAGMQIAQAVFPILRLVMDEVFVDAIAELNTPHDAHCHLLGDLRRPLIPPQSEDPDPDGLPWNLDALGLATISDGEMGDAIVVGMIDGAVAVRHPALAAGMPRFENVDYPVPAGDEWCMSSKGIGHGTAMAGLVIGQEGARRYGVAPGAELYPIRAANLSGDRHENRVTLALRVLEAGLAGDRFISDINCEADRTIAAKLGVLLLSLDFQRPDAAAAGYLDMAKIAELRADDPDAATALIDAVDPENAVDPFVLAILIVQSQIAVVIPAGNSGAQNLAYPAAFDDYAPVLQAIIDDETRPKVISTVAALLRQFSATLEDDVLGDATDLVTEATTLLAQGLAAQEEETGASLDAFESTGIVVVGASSPIDGALTKTNYSQSGPGLCVMGPSDGDHNPPYRCPTSQVPAPGFGSAQNSRPVRTLDILGPGGFADDPLADESHSGQATGFGGTSAAAAQIAGAIAIIASRMNDPLLLTGPQLRADLIDLAGDDYSPTTGYGPINLGGL
ncbi:hypothetical protein So717_07840 [Roseobacter cerasinus]|uniref:Peptidase S8/S53 domain-containing protein n=1 Tax=Roseobacter cerasinus TaxID=2602289 RepID=A0A640VPM3_9RHOB|nr:S8 family serine peptidase [Roseobacter cerasinus]GFE49031.1 hypothetical protein So717_07840 [Roseobacter cerasinus]